MINLMEEISSFNIFYIFVFVSNLFIIRFYIVVVDYRSNSIYFDIINMIFVKLEKCICC